jgi:hypothetical protein
MSELKLFTWATDKKANLINSVPKGTPVFIYGKTKSKADKAVPIKDAAW